MIWWVLVIICLLVLAHLTVRRVHGDTEGVPYEGICWVLGPIVIVARWKKKEGHE